MKFDTKKITGSWFLNCKERGWTRHTILAANPNLEPLKQKLLDLGGSAACIWDEPDYYSLMSRGRVWDGTDAIMHDGDRNSCHRNTARLWTSQRENGFEVCTGWALSSDGMWRQHSWGLLNNEIVETTEPRVAYYGFVMSQTEALRFSHSNM